MTDYDVTNYDPVAERLARWAELTDGATPGPWQCGDVWQWAGIMPELFGADECAFCHRLGAPVWTGEADINGTTEPAHKHHDPEPYGSDHWVSGPDGLVAGPVGDDEGGIGDPADTRFVTEARTAMPELLAFVRDVLGMCDDVDEPFYPCVPTSHGGVPVAAVRVSARRHLGGVG